MSDDLGKKIAQGVRLIRSAYACASDNGSELEVSYSGGKDSDVILELTKMAEVPYRAIYRNTTIDPVGTLQHVRANGVEVYRPKKSFFELVKSYGYPNRFTRTCCGYLKEFPILNYAILGIRRCESTKRAARYREPEVCRVYHNGGRCRQYYPILEWSDADVAEFIRLRGIKCHPLYYDSDGVFHVERRLGCVGCPLLYYKRRIESFKTNPKMVRAYLRAGKIYRDTHPDLEVVKKFEDEYAWFACKLFYDEKETRAKWDVVNSSDGIFGNDKPDWKAYLENYFQIKL